VAGNLSQASSLHPAPESLDRYPPFRGQDMSVGVGSFRTAMSAHACGGRPGDTRVLRQGDVGVPQPMCGRGRLVNTRASQRLPQIFVVVRVGSRGSIGAMPHEAVWIRPVILLPESLQLVHQGGRK
jgi:hypothetical protein